jgi:hypothetical protein
MLNTPYHYTLVRLGTCLAEVEDEPARLRLGDRNRIKSLGNSDGRHMWAVKHTTGTDDGYGIVPIA